MNAMAKRFSDTWGALGKEIPPNSMQCRRPNLAWRGAVGLATALLLAGCGSTQKLRLHLAIAEVDRPNPEVKFYRVNIRARASNVKTSFETGYYDANALRELYGEVKKPAQATAPPPGLGTHQFVFNPRTGQWDSLAENQLFTVVFGADAKAIAAEIKTFAESDQTGQQMARLIGAASGREYYIEAVAAERGQTEQKARVTALAGALQARAAEAAKLDPASMTPESLDQLLLRAAQAAARQLGSETQFRTDAATNGFQDAKQLYDLLKKTGGSQ